MRERQQRAQKASIANQRIAEIQAKEEARMAEFKRQMGLK
jgi:hypothetical protein